VGNVQDDGQQGNSAVLSPLSQQHYTPPTRIQVAHQHPRIPHTQTKQGGSPRAHLLPIHNIPRPHLISKEPREILRPCLELEPFLMFPPLVLSVEVAMPVLPLVVVLVFEEGVDRAAVD
jgi:hypothetical protein